MPSSRTETAPPQPQLSFKKKLQLHNFRSDMSDMNLPEGPAGKLSCGPLLTFPSPCAWCILSSSNETYKHHYLVIYTVQSKIRVHAVCWFIYLTKISQEPSHPQMRGRVADENVAVLIAVTWSYDFHTLTALSCSNSSSKWLADCLCPGFCLSGCVQVTVQASDLVEDEAAAWEDDCRLQKKKKKEDQQPFSTEKHIYF